MMNGDQTQSSNQDLESVEVKKSKTDSQEAQTWEIDKGSYNCLKALSHVSMEEAQYNKWNEAIENEKDLWVLWLGETAHRVKVCSVYSEVVAHSLS